MRSDTHRVQHTTLLDAHTPTYILYRHPVRPERQIDYSLLCLECHSISISNLNLVGLFSTECGKRDLDNQIIDWALRTKKWHSKWNRLNLIWFCSGCWYIYDLTPATHQHTPLDTIHNPEFYIYIYIYIYVHIYIYTYICIHIYTSDKAQWRHANEQDLS